MKAETDQLAYDVVHLLASRGETVATCESLTAGLVAAKLADIPGSSQVLRGGLVTYATDLKISLAEVDSDLVLHGVVTPGVARAMAEGTRVRCQSDWGISTTGVAGPGPHEGVQAGTVWVGVSGKSSSVVQISIGDVGRKVVREAAVHAVLQLLWQHLTVE